MQLCTYCSLNGYCKTIRTRLVTDQELANPDFIRDVKSSARSLGIMPHAWLDALSDMYCHYRGCIVDSSDREIFLDLEPLERPHIREWFRDWVCAPLESATCPRVRSESRERIRVLATILRACSPVRAQMWGVRAANDNAPPSPPPQDYRADIPRKTCSFLL